ncbi:MAG: hypothetical protein GKR90_15995 [Pseudomonadales bacterium]|nr:hypothetical protein [Pseudomonadales bacterium]
MTTIWIAKLISPVLVALSMAMIFKPKHLQETTERFLEDRPLILISGVLAMVAGLATINSHNIWVLDWPVIVTLFGWALTMGGAVRIILPNFVEEVGETMSNRPTMTRLAGIFWGLIGLYLAYKAYW